ncbi:hypothetical protein [Haloarcula montana]|uniref:hypothetical protein n=1 Tax=Haloarcula montana TaxID=3111776 RepID=UPI002D77C103|nr:hypothetical protein [Haloarcula sp. GH36]
MSPVSPSVIAYGFGAVFGILAVVYFARDILLSLSVTSKLALLYAGSLSLLAVGVFGDGATSLVGFVIGGAGYAVASFYLVKWYKWRRSGRFVISAISAVLFVCLGWLLSSGVINGEIELAGATGVILGGVAVTLAAVDRNEGEVVRYKLTIAETIDPGTDRIGTVEVTNESALFRHAFELPSFRCVVENGPVEQRIPITVGSVVGSDASATIGAGETCDAPIQIEWRAVEKQLEEAELSFPDSYETSVTGEDAHRFTTEAGETINVELY